MPTRKEQRETREKEILYIALDLFIRKGFEGTRIQDIAKAANMSTGLLFHYFSSKEKLYESLVEYGVYGPQNMMKVNTDDPLIFFHTVTESLLSFIKENPFASKLFILMVQVHYQDPITEHIKDLVSKLTTIEDTIPIIEKGQKLGQIKSGNPHALSLLYWSAIQGVAQSCSMDATLPIPETEWFLSLLKK